jgi:hypothetical protein
MGARWTPTWPGKFITSSTTGQGSILTIQKDGKAGAGSVSNPLLVTVTAKTHLDVTSGLPAQNDYQAGVIYMTSSATTVKDNGLGVVAFTVGTDALRTFSGTAAKIEGSKEVSGGTDPNTTWDGMNGAPHVDEEAIFNFNTSLNLAAKSFTITLTKFDGTGTGGGLNGTQDAIWLHIDLVGGGSRELQAATASNSGGANPLFTQIGAAADQVFNVNFNATVLNLSATDRISSFFVRAIDDNPSAPTGTAEHFLINGFTYSDNPVGADGVPLPATVWGGLVLLGGMSVRRNRAKRQG